MSEPLHCRIPTRWQNLTNAAVPQLDVHSKIRCNADIVQVVDPIEQHQIASR